jgi:hypothetical protein
MYSVSDVKEVIEQEGVVYTVMDYLSIEYIDDEKLRLLFTDAKQALEGIENYLVEETGEEMDYG